MCRKTMSCHEDAHGLHGSYCQHPAVERAPDQACRRGVAAMTSPLNIPPAPSFLEYSWTVGTTMARAKRDKNPEYITRQRDGNEAIRWHSWSLLRSSSALQDDVGLRRATCGVQGPSLCM